MASPTIGSIKLTNIILQTELEIKQNLNVYGPFGVFGIRYERFLPRSGMKDEEDTCARRETLAKRVSRDSAKVTHSGRIIQRIKLAALPGDFKWLLVLTCPVSAASSDGRCNT